MLLSLIIQSIIIHIKSSVPKDIPLKYILGKHDRIREKEAIVKRCNGKKCNNSNE